MSIMDHFPDKVRAFLEEEQYREYLILGVGAAVCLIYIAIAIVPGVLRLGSNITGIAQANIRITQLNEKVKKLAKTSEELAKLRAELETYSRGLPDQKEISTFLEGISSVAEGANIKILSITPIDMPELGAKDDKTFYHEVPIVLTAKGGYHQLGDFISRLESGERVITIKDLKINNSSKTPRVHDIRMVLLTYVASDNMKE
ncbi:MAG: type 4a pilus biogenesis protein PilO [Candidatus Omnitrophica bacterium]|nr:type 4a pilus biogenesis protein PilO [Candidatus Omnitrophota bacterium]MDD5488382.1 type 4a pilus biogenesis protein PilO [Candidatus Omnitrophota bacterium]